MKEYTALIENVHKADLEYSANNLAQTFFQSVVNLNELRAKGELSHDDFVAKVADMAHATHDVMPHAEHYNRD